MAVSTLELRTVRGAVITVVVARGLRRATGLILRAAPPPNHGLLFYRCKSLHGFGMRVPLDVVFLDRRMCVIRVAELRPGRVVSEARARHAFELASGEAARLEIVVGDVLSEPA